jgi:predicted Fe-Mo cluster-binding NifX family protein
MDSIVISVPSDQRVPDKVSLYAIRALASQGVQAILTGHVKDICREAMNSLGMEVIDGVPRMTVRQAIELYASHGAKAVRSYEPPPTRIAVASHGTDLDAPLSKESESCTSFILVDLQSMEFEIVNVEPADSPEQTSVNAVRAAARAGATVVITPQMRPACCTALRALAIDVALSRPHMTVRQAVEAYQRDQLQSPPHI